MPKGKSGIKRGGDSSKLTLQEIADDIQGNRWTKGDKDRLYMSTQDIGFSSYNNELSEWNTISNVDMKTVNQSVKGTINKNDIGYIDLKTGEFVVPESNNRSLIIERMKYRVEQARLMNEGTRYAIEKEYRDVPLPSGGVKTQSRTKSEGFKKILDAPYGTEFSVKPAPDSVTGKVGASRRYVVTIGNGGGKALQRITADGYSASIPRIPIDSEVALRKLMSKDTSVTIHKNQISRDRYLNENNKRANEALK